MAIETGSIIAGPVQALLNEGFHYLGHRDSVSDPGNPQTYNGYRVPGVEDHPSDLQGFPASLAGREAEIQRRHGYGFPGQKNLVYMRPLGPEYDGPLLQTVPELNRSPKAVDPNGVRTATMLVFGRR